MFLKYTSTFKYTLRSLRYLWVALLTNRINNKLDRWFNQWACAEPWPCPFKPEKWKGIEKEDDCLRAPDFKYGRASHGLGISRSKQIQQLKMVSVLKKHCSVHVLLYKPTWDIIPLTNMSLYDKKYQEKKRQETNCNTKYFDIIAIVSKNSMSWQFQSNFCFSKQIWIELWILERLR